MLRSKPRQELIAQVNLTQQNYTVYYPQAQIEAKIVSLFPGYMFVQLDKELDNFFPIRSTKGVLNLIRFGMEYAIVPDEVIQLIQSEQQQTTDKIIDLSKFHAGDKVKVTQGALQTQNAIFAEYDGDKRVIVLLSFLGKQQKIKLNYKQIEAR